MVREKHPVPGTVADQERMEKDGIVPRERTSREDVTKTFGKRNRESLPIQRMLDPSDLVDEALHTKTSIQSGKTE
mgnify:CR=1 FL=1